MRCFIYLLLLLFGSSFVNAQSLFSEGRVVYDIYIGDNGEKTEGEFILTVKKQMFKREMHLNSGTTNVTISNLKAGETVSYNNINGNKYAQKIMATDVAKQNEKFAGAKYELLDSNITVAGEPCIKYKVIYKDGKSNVVCVAKKLLPELKEINAMFNELTGLPLSYEVYFGSKKIVLKAREIKVVPIENSEFSELKGYVIMDKNELR